LESTRKIIKKPPTPLPYAASRRLTFLIARQILDTFTQGKVVESCFPAFCAFQELGESSTHQNAEGSGNSIMPAWSAKLYSPASEMGLRPQRQMR